MHDFLLAKEIMEKLTAIAKEKKLTKVRLVKLELGQISLAHDGFSEHVEEISEENLLFGLESVAKNTPFAGTRFEIKRIEGDNWKISEIETEE